MNKGLSGRSKRRKIREEIIAYNLDNAPESYSCTGIGL